MTATTAKPTPAQARAINTAIDNGGRTASDPYQLRTIATLVQAGWMTEPDGRTLEVTDAGRAAVGRPAEPTPASYVVHFARIGRNHQVAPLLTGPVDGPSHLAELIYRHARPHLVSNDIEVIADLPEGKGHILAGFNNGGSFTIHQPDEAVVCEHCPDPRAVDEYA